MRYVVFTFIVCSSLPVYGTPPTKKCYVPPKCMVAHIDCMRPAPGYEECCRPLCTPTPPRNPPPFLRPCAGLCCNVDCRYVHNPICCDSRLNTRETGRGHSARRFGRLRAVRVSKFVDEPGDFASDPPDHGAREPKGEPKGDAKGDKSGWDVVREEMGAARGRGIGEAVGSDAGRAIGGRVGAAVGGRAGPVGAAAGAAVGGYVGDKVGREVGGKIGEHVGREWGGKYLKMKYVKIKKPHVFRTRKTFFHTKYTMKFVRKHR